MMRSLPLVAALISIAGCQSGGYFELDDDDDVDDGTDADEDGWTVEDGDCDDADPAVHPDADEEPCDDVDNDCDPQTADDPEDADGDGWTACGGDCDDGDAAVFPEASEVCEESADENCDGEVDEECLHDLFEQTSSLATDMLWVVDNSCSMQEEQDNLGGQFAALYDALGAAGVDFHIAVVTTDTAQFQGQPSFIDPATADATQVFAQAVRVGTNGSGTEQGLLQGWNALELAVEETPPNQGFYRPDAGLQLVFVSDEADQSGAWSGYLASYLSLKNDPSNVYLNAIVGTDGADAVDCEGYGGSAFAGTGYVDVAHATDGLLVSICEPDWSALMANLAVQTIRISAAFPLSQEPIVESLAVFVDGELQTDGWTYQGDTHEILFDEQHVPSLGAIIRVNYQT